MKYKGITYDVGTEYSPGLITRDNLIPDEVNVDMDAIKNKLHCNSVRIYGKEPERLLLATEVALQYGIDVWLSPRLIDGNPEDTLSYLHGIAVQFELLRQKFTGREMVFIVAGEATIDTKGFVKGNSISERTSNLLTPLFFFKNAIGLKPSYQKTFNMFLKEAAADIRRVFKGSLTYCSGMWEKADWSDFDYVSMNLYWASFNKSIFDTILKKLNSIGKQVIISEFGCCSYEGAYNKGPTGHSVLDLSKKPPVFKEKCIRSEKVQADYILDLLKRFDNQNITGSFVFDFFSPKLIHSSDPEKDFDMAGYSVTRSIGNGLWEPKESFHRIGDYYRDH